LSTSGIEPTISSRPAHTQSELSLVKEEHEQEERVVKKKKNNQCHAAYSILKN
jgi:hypothetical protein